MRNGSTRGVTLVEVMVSLLILLIGMIGLMQFQMVGVTSNQGARAHTTAAQLARELAAALQELPVDSPLLAPAALGATPPDPFGRLGGTEGAGIFDVTSDAGGGAALPGVTLDAALDRDPGDATRSAYQRRWTVWGRNDAGGAVAASFVIAVSVTYRDRAMPAPGEVVVYVNRSNPTAVMGNIAAFE